MVVFMMKLWCERHKILIAGAYGTGNLGDEAILQGLLKMMRANNLLVFSRDPAETTQLHSVRAKRRNILDVLLAEKLLIGGGELLQDNMAWKYALLAITSKILRKKVTVYAVGVSHLSNSIERIFARICLNLVDEISVRDPDSKNRLLDMGITKVIDVVDDPSINVASALYTEVSEIFDREGISKSNFLIGVTLRYTRNNETNRILINFFTNYFKDIIEQCTNVQILFLVFSKHKDSELDRDEAFGRDLSNSLNDERFRVIDSILTPSQMLAVIANTDFIISARLHPLLFASRANMPRVGIALYPKIESFSKIYGFTAVGLESLEDLYEIFKGAIS